MWKLLTGKDPETMYRYLERNGVVPHEQKFCKRKGRDTVSLILMEKTVSRGFKRRETNLAMSWIDYRKVYDMIPHSWIMGRMKLFDIASNIE